MTLAVLRAGRWPAVVAGALVLGLVGWLGGQDLVSVPVLTERVPVRLLVAVAAVPVALLPLYARFPELSATFVREPAARAGRVAGACLVAAVAFAPAALVSRSPDVATDTALLAVLLALGIGAVVAVGDLAWLAATGAGFVAVFVDTSGSAPVTRALLATPDWVPWAAVAVAALAYGRLGARRTASGEGVDD